MVKDSRPALALRPVGVVGGGVDAGDALVTRLRTAADREVGLVRRRRGLLRRRLGQPLVGRGEELPAALDRRPALGGPPFLGVHGEVMDGRFVQKAGLAAGEMLVEEAQHLAQHRQFRLDPGAPRRDIDARAMVPRPQHDAAIR